MIPEGDEAPRERPPREVERDVLAERRARRAWLSGPALARRAEAAEATAHTLEAHLADLRRRQVKAERERELASAQLAERELELRRVKQREYAEQQLRVEAEQAAVRLRRGHRAELDRMQRRAEEARAAAQHAEEQRDVLAGRLAGVSESCAALQRGVAALQSAVAGLRAALESDHQVAQARIRELESALECALARAPRGALEGSEVEGSETETETEDALRREEMGGALAAAVERLRARVEAVGEQPQIGRQSAGAPDRSKIGWQTAEIPGWLAAEAPPAVEEHAPPAGVPLKEDSMAPVTEKPLLSAPAQEISTVIVVPRLFPPTGGHAARFAPAVRRVAARLARWADRVQDRPR